MNSTWVQRNRVLILVGVVALLLRGIVIWRYSNWTDEDRDLYREIAVHLVQGEGFSRSFVWNPSSEHADTWELKPVPAATTREDESNAGSERNNFASAPVFVVSSTEIRRLVPNIQPGQRFTMPTAYRPPLYPLLVASILVITKTHHAVAWFQVFLGSLTAVGTAMIAQRGGRPRAGLIAGLIVALDPLLLGQSPLIMTETLAAALTTMFCLLGETGSLHGNHANRMDYDPTPPISFRSTSSLGYLFRASVTVSFATLCRPTFLVAGILWALWLMCEWFLRSPRSQSPPTPNRNQRTLWLILGLTLPIIVWGIRNRIEIGSWTFATTHGGYTLFLTQNEHYANTVLSDDTNGLSTYLNTFQTATEFKPPRLPADQVGHFEIALDRHYSQLGWEHIAASPGRAIHTAISLQKRFWSIVPSHAPGLSRTVITGIGVWNSLVFIGVGVGFVRAVRTRALRSLIVPLALIIGFCLVHSIYWTDMRMRTPIVPALALLAAWSTPTKQGQDSQNGQARAV